MLPFWRWKITKSVGRQDKQPITAKATQKIKYRAVAGRCLLGFSILAEWPLNTHLGGLLPLRNVNSALLLLF